jgi:CheY-like chemotaxis protein
VRVLLIDDNADLVESLARVLKSAGHEIETASNSPRALGLHRERPADVLITDIFMPGIDGIETIAAFRSQWPRLKIIAMSGGGKLAKGDYLGVARAIGADAVLRKPFDPQQLLNTLEALCPKQ